MCTRVFENRFADVRVVGRTLDWAVTDEAALWHFPRGLERGGGASRQASWTVEYRNLAISMWGSGSTEGMNEAGLSAHLLYLDASDYGERDDRPGVHQLMWAQYVIDRYATVAEAIARIDEVQIVPRSVRGQTLGAHLSLEDASGDSAIIEMIDGSPVVHHGKEFRVMTNDPTFDEQLVSLGRYRPFGGTLEIPGDILSDQRFARATYFLDHLVEPRDHREAVAGVLSVTRNAAVPFGAPYDEFSTYPTWWASVMDLVSRTYYFQSTLAPNVVWAELDDVAVGDLDKVLTVDPSDPALSGSITSRLVEAPAPY